MSREKFASLTAVAVAVSLVWAASAQAAFPGANGKIAFDRSDGSDQEINVVNPDGSGLTTLTSADQEDVAPAWSPDGQRIVFARITFGEDFSSEIWVMNADGSGQTRLTTGADDNDPAFSASGGQIFFSRRNPSADHDIWVMNADGSGQTRLTDDGADDREPTAAANGNLVAFWRGLLGNSVIYTMTPGGANQTPITDDHEGMDIRDTSPNFSPDSANIVFGRCPGGLGLCAGPSSLYRVPAAGGATTPLTSNTVSGSDPEDFRPAFAPNGSRIVFERFNPDSSLNLAFIGPSGGAVQAFVGGIDPDWQPLRTPSSTTSCYGRTATIVGTDENDKLIGTPGDDVFKGLKGRDKIKGKGGDDIACGQRGRDRLFGGRGDDILHGGSGRDFLKGGPGLDQIFGGTRDAKNAGQVVDICVFGDEDKTNNCKAP